jgi:hypothetical protein
MRLSKHFGFAVVFIAGVSLADATQAQEPSSGAESANDHRSAQSRRPDGPDAFGKPAHGKKGSEASRPVDHARDKEPKGSVWNGFYGGLNAGPGRGAAPPD